MSVVTDIMVVSLGDYGFDALNVWLRSNHSDPTYRVLEKVSQHAGGEKAMQCNIYMGAFNYLDVDGFISAFKAVEWEFPEHTQLMVKHEHEDRFTTYLVKD